MKKIHRLLAYQYQIILSLVLFFFSTLVCSDPVDNYLQCEMKKLKIPGLSLAVVKNGEIIKSKGYGFSNIELHTAATPETIYQSGSVAKQFTAMLTIILIEKGVLHLDDKISRYITNAPIMWKDITIRHLLTHTSGVIRYNPESDIRLDYSDDELIRRLSSYPLDFQPGTDFRYSNSGYEILGIILQKVTGKSYNALLQEHIFKSLQMNTARVIGNRDNIVMNRAAGYDPIVTQSGIRLKNEDYSSTTFNTTADHALYFSVLDLAKWDKALYTTKLINEEDKKLMWSPVTFLNGKTENYGFGWRLENINGHRVVEHGGEVSGFTAFISRFIDDKLTIIIMTNLSGNAELGNITHHVASLYNKELEVGAKKTEDNLCQ